MMPGVGEAVGEPDTPRVAPRRAGNGAVPVGGTDAPLPTERTPYDDPKAVRSSTESLPP